MLECTPAHCTIYLVKVHIVSILDCNTATKLWPLQRDSRREERRKFWQGKGSIAWGYPIASLDFADVLEDGRGATLGFLVDGTLGRPLALLRARTATARPRAVGAPPMPTARPAGPTARAAGHHHDPAITPSSMHLP